jgi:hypothetical protein
MGPRRPRDKSVFSSTTRPFKQSSAQARISPIIPRPIGATRPVVSVSWLVDYGPGPLGRFKESLGPVLLNFDTMGAG